MKTPFRRTLVSSLCLLLGSTAWAGVPDTTPPDTTIIFSPAALTNTSSATFSFNGFDDQGFVSFECSLDGGAFAVCSSPATLTGLADGMHTFQVRAVDGVSNVDPTPAAYTWTIDTVAPPAPVVITPANGSTIGNPMPVVTGTAEPSTLATVFIDGSQTGFTTTDASGNWSVSTTTPLAEGSHTVRARATDAASNTSPDSNTNTFIIDMTAPDTVISSTPTNPSNSANAAFSFNGNDGSGSGVAGFECSLDGAAFTACTAPNSLTGLIDGAHSFQVRAIDAAGNVDPTPASFAWTVDTTPPSAPVVTAPANGATVTTTTPTLAGTAEANSAVTVLVDGTPSGTTSADASGNWSVVSAALAAGAHTVRARASDDVGNTSVDSNTNNFTVLIDASAPDTLIVSGPASLSNSSSASFDVDGSDDVGVVGYECSLDGGAFAACTDPVTLTSLADGAHTLQVRARDGVGNVDPTPATYGWTVDTTPPAAPVITSPANGATLTTTTPTLSGSAEPNSSVTIFIDGAPAGTSTANASGAWSFTSAALAIGAHNTFATATDAAGNTSPNSATHAFTIVLAQAVVPTMPIPSLSVFAMLALVLGLLVMAQRVFPR